MTFRAMIAEARRSLVDGMFSTRKEGGSTEKTTIFVNDIRSTFDMLINIRDSVYDAQQGRRATENLFDAMKDLNFLISVYEPSGWDG